MLPVMSRVPASAALMILTLAATPAAAQPSLGAEAPVATAPAPPPPAPPVPVIAAPAPVQVTALAAPDAFTTPARDTGLPATLWQGASVQIVRAVLPLLADKPLSPAAAALARRVLATGAPGPQGAGADPALAAARAAALLGQGDPRGAAAILARAPGLDRNPDLARVAAESALLAREDARACQIEANLTAGRDDIYWVRLRTYCQAIAGKTTEAQLTFDLANSQAKDAVFARLMGAKLAGGGDPGPAALRNGLDYALSNNLGLDLAAAKPSAAVAAALAGAGPTEPTFAPPTVAPDLTDAAQAIAAQGPFPTVALERLLDAAEVRDPKARARPAAAALIAAAFVEPLGPTLRARVAALPVPEGRAPAGRNLALEAAAAERRIGEAALLVLWTCADAGPAGPTAADRARMVGALRRVGLEADARNFALEGLASQK